MLNLATFTLYWKRSNFSDVVQDISSGVSVNSEDRSSANGELGILKTSCVYSGTFDFRQHKAILSSEYERAKLNPKADAIVVSRMNTPALVGASGYVVKGHKNLFFPDRLWQVTTTEEVCSRWFSFILASPKYRDLLGRAATGTSGSMKNLSQAAFLQLPILVPPLAEQRKIAEILSTWDEAIDKTEQLITVKERQLQGLRLIIFEAEYRSHNNIVYAKDFLEPVSERGRTELALLAVMQDIGVVRRDDLDRRVVMPDGDISNYKVVRPGNFIISLRSFEGGLEYSNIKGLVSPAYTVLKPKKEIDREYYRHFFKSRSFIGRVDKLIYGIRDGKQIPFRDFGDMKVPFPSVDEQESAAKALNELERFVELEQRRSELLKRQKRGLMQKLLTGEWRVDMSEVADAGI